MEKFNLAVMQVQGPSDGWKLDCSTDTEELVAPIEREVCSRLMLLGGSVMTVENEQEETMPGPSTSGQ